METGSPSNSTAPFRLYDELQLLEFPDRFIVKSVQSPDKGFSIGRHEGNIELLGSDTSVADPCKVSTIYGVAGTIRLLAGTYLLVITSREEVGRYLGSPVFRVMSMEFVSCNESLRLSTSYEKRDEAYFMSLLKTVESTPGLYYSYETDMTVNLQRRVKLGNVWHAKPLWKQADPRFVWNRNLLEELIEYKLHLFFSPKYMSFGNLNIYLSFQSVQIDIKECSVTITLVSRRCTRRLGTRMWRRGANLEGATANFIETEQLLEAKGFKSSILQIRGSIPLLWEQIVDLSYKPRLRIIDHEQTPKVVERHFSDVAQRYGETIAVDLTDQVCHCVSYHFIMYVHFDFHHACGNSRLENLQLLFNEIADNFEKQGYFLMDSDGNTVKHQTGIVRSNCIDCLDRTNVTQAFLAQKSLNIQLQKIGVFSSDESISMFGELYEKFLTMWVDQGDEISLEYAGTHALKRDMVRFGKQTFSGIIKDGMSALSRYYLNNFQDGLRQDAIDLIIGRYNINRNNPSPFPLNGFESLSYLPVASALVIGGLTWTSLTFNQAGRHAQHFISTVVWAGVAAGVMAVVKANGRQFCSRPRLCGLL
ncbi:hypothetical protein QQ045_003301 [Rhodiola kirilowii]